MEGGPYLLCEDFFGMFFGMFCSCFVDWWLCSFCFSVGPLLFVLCCFRDDTCVACCGTLLRWIGPDDGILQRRFNE
jgi:hypothetical protein